MNISYTWLNEFLDVDLTPEETANVLTSIGLENGPVEAVETVKGGLEGLLIGEVLTCTDHPDSDHLHCTTVNVGTGDPLSIVCGAPNVAAGQKVVVATIGTKLYDGDQVFVIKKSKIRGQESHGMICAEDEIGIGASHDGIIVLPADAPVGMKASEYYGIKKEYILEVDITPNRADAASHYGVARDLAAYLKQKNPLVQLRRPSVDDFAVENNDFPVQVDVLNSEACPRYAGVTLTGIHVQESPKWLKDRLLAIGVRPINNVVDVTNYLLHETGQPLHAFDGAAIKGNVVRVQTRPAGTRFTTLDGIERELADTDLMICNAEGPMCIAGVFGGLDSGVTETSTSVFLESAYFHPVWVRRTARRHGLNTDASFRFERGIDPDNTVYVLKRAALMIRELAGGSISSNIVDVYPTPLKGFEVELDMKKVCSLIGKQLTIEEVRSILNALEIKINSEQAGVMQLTVPAYRVDVQRDVDVIEDIMRIHGYNAIEFDDTIRATLSHSVKPDSHKIQQLLSEQLTANGFYEILNNSLSSASYYEGLETLSPDRCVALMNPLSNDLAVMRQSLLFGGLESIAHNQNRRRGDLKLYEFGNCYHRCEGKEGEALSTFAEGMHMALWMCGKVNEGSWYAPAAEASFFDLKAQVEALLARMGIARSTLSIEETSTELLSHALVYRLRSGELLLEMGQVKNALLKRADIDVPVYYADIRWASFLTAASRNNVQYAEISKYPEVKRDLALLVDRSVRFADIERVAAGVEKRLLKSVQLFDVYEGKNLPQGKKSYAVAFVLQDERQTLTDKQIDAVMNKMIQQFEKQLNASLR